MIDISVIKDLMAAKRITAYRLSKIVGTSTSHTTNLLNGKIIDPQFNLVCKIADALEVSVDDLRIKEDDECEKIITEFGFPKKNKWDQSGYFI